MQIKKHLSPCQIIIEKVFSKTDLDKIEEEILKDERKKTNIPGFRPGNAPLDKIREILQANRKYEEYLGIKLQEEIISDWVKEKETELGEIVKIENIEFKQKESLTLECQLEYFPRLEEKDLQDYKNLKINQKQKIADLKVSDEEIEKNILELQEQRTILKPTTKPLGENCYALLELNFLAQEKEIIDGKKNQDLFQWGIGQYGKEFDQEIKGKKEGDLIIIKLNKENDKNLEKLKKIAAQNIISLKLPDDQCAEIAIKAKKIFLSEKPELNDEFAKSLGKFKNLDELKSSMKHGLTLEKLYKECDARKENFLQSLLETIKVEIPDSLLERNAEKYKKNFEQHLEQELKTTQKNPSKKDRETLNEIFKEKSKRELALQRILEAIALKEKIMPEEEEVEKEIRKILQDFRSPKEAKNILGDTEEFRSKITLSVCFEKTLKFLEKENNLLGDIEAKIAEIEKEHHKN